jgi:hypothetical protein
LEQTKAMGKMMAVSLSCPEMILSAEMRVPVLLKANLFFAKQFGIDPSQGDTSKNQWLLGLVNWHHMYALPPRL